jgi:hypothetical protein
MARCRSILGMMVRRRAAIRSPAGRKIERVMAVIVEPGLAVTDPYAVASALEVAVVAAELTRPPQAIMTQMAEDGTVPRASLKQAVPDIGRPPGRSVMGQSGASGCQGGKGKESQHLILRLRSETCF